METKFETRLSAIDRDKIREYLLSLEKPCYESTLLHIAFPEMAISSASALSLYQHHFLLYHTLYILQDEFYARYRLLYIHFMRTFLIAYPEKGFCRSYDPYLARFCAVACETGHDHCQFHENRMGDGDIDRLSDRYFYLDSANFYHLDENTAKSFLDGTWEILAHYADWKESFRILDLPESSDLPMIKRKFRTLAKQYHPDLGEQSAEKFNEINRAYRLLLKMFYSRSGINIDISANK